MPSVVAPELGADTFGTSSWKTSTSTTGTDSINGLAIQAMVAGRCFCIPAANFCNFLTMGVH